MPQNDILSEYTASDIHNSMNALINALGGLSEDITALRTELADMRSELRSYRDHTAVQDAEIWGPDKEPRHVALSRSITAQGLSIKGLWAVVVMHIGATIGYIVSHLR